MHGYSISFLVQPIVSYRGVHKITNLTTTAGMMMLRVWAMYNRSKPLLRILLTFFFLEIIFSVIGTAINSNPKNVSGT